MEKDSVRLVGEDKYGTLFEWYGDSGGQLKYYPLAKNAVWISDIFHLEPLPTSREYGIVTRTKEYFPYQWNAVLQAEIRSS